MNKILIAGCAMATAFAAVAMPTKKELAQAQKLVEDVTRADLKAIEAGAKSAKDVADLHKTLADKSEQEAEKYLLLQGAFKLYARSEEFDLAAEMLLAINREVEGVPPELILELINDEFHRGMGKKAPKVLAIFKQAKRTVKFQKELATTEKALKAKTKDPALNRKYGECQAELGNWKGAAIAFAKAGGDLAKMVAAEKDNSLPPQQIADFWWEYGGETGITPYKVHAAELYQKALTDNKSEGLSRERASLRINEMRVDTVGASILVKTIDSRIKSPNLPKDRDGRMAPLSFDVGGGHSIELLNCPAGKCAVERTWPWRYDAATVAVPRTFWVSKYPVTQGLWRQVMGINTPYTEHERALGGDVGVQLWISYADVCKFCDRLNSEFGHRLPRGYVFRVPSLVEYIYATKGGAANERDPYYHSTTPEMLRPKIALQMEEIKAMISKQGIAKVRVFGHQYEDVSKLSYWDHSGGEVGHKMPNKWGLYDMVGIADYYLLDTFGRSENVNADVITKNGRGDGQPVLKKAYLERFGKEMPFFYSDEGFGTSTWTRWGDCYLSEGIDQDRPRTWHIGCRIVIGPDLVSEWKAKQKK